MSKGKSENDRGSRQRSPLVPPAIIHGRHGTDFNANGDFSGKIGKEHKVELNKTFSIQKTKHVKHIPLSPETIDNFEEEIESESQSLESRLHELERFAIKNGGNGVADYARELFPELTEQLNTTAEHPASSLPSIAPETYQGLRGPETPPAFVQRVYGPWLGHGLTRAHIRTLDSKLYDAINNWTSRAGNEWPAEVDLPTKAEQNTRDLETLRATAADGQIGRVLGDFTAREAGRIRSALQRREK